MPPCRAPCYDRRAVQSVESPRTSGGPRKLRPWFLVATMIIAWFVGVNGVTSGCDSVAILRAGVIPDRAGLERSLGGDGEPAQAVAAAHQAARIKAMVDARETAFPLGVAKLLLSALLVVASAMALAGRPGARAFAIQAVLVYAAFAALDFALSHAMRASWIPEVAAAAAEIARGSPQQAIFGDARIWWWSERARFGILDLATMAAAFFALLAPRSKAYFAAMAATASAARRDDDDDA
jgi:hypothetical protein